ncbi:MFS transporter [Paenibacillus sanguinis]|uniref:MFS transporter n=1 Tax=Paenibacillus sanguinis TaxID=225906 RepID=UPI00035E2528|nr:MFS transporter [Paenibacillus sanguinis]
MSSLRILRQEKPYCRLLLAGLINGIGDRFSQVAVLGLLLSLTGSGLAIGINFAVRLFPYLIFGPFGGLLADRFPKKTVMIFTDLIRCMFALIPLLVHEPDDVWIIYVSSFALSAGEALYAPARMSLIPRLVHRDNLLAVNSLEQAMIGLVLICGSVTGGIVAATIGSDAAFVLNSLSFLISGLLLIRLKNTGLSAATPPDTIVSPAAASALSRSERWNDCKRFLSESFFLRIMLVAFALWPIGSGIFNILISVYASEVFKMGDIGIGLLYGALGAGMLTGSSLAGKMSGHMRTAAIAAMVLEGIIQTIISQTPSFLLLMLLLSLSAIIISIGNACNETVLMQLIPAAWQGRFFGGLATLENAVMGATMFFGGLLLEVMSPRSLGFAAGLLVTVLGLSLYLIWYRHNRKVSTE